MNEDQPISSEEMKSSHRAADQQLEEIPEMDKSNYNNEDSAMFLRPYTARESVQSNKTVGECSPSEMNDIENAFFGKTLSNDIEEGQVQNRKRKSEHNSSQGKPKKKKSKKKDALPDESILSQITGDGRIFKARFKFEGDPRKNPLRPNLLFFSCTHLYFFLSCSIPWPILSSKEEGSTRAQCFYVLLLRMFAIII